MAEAMDVDITFNETDNDVSMSDWDISKLLNETNAPNKSVIFPNTPHNQYNQHNLQNTNVINSKFEVTDTHYATNYTSNNGNHITNLNSTFEVPNENHKLNTVNGNANLNSTFEIPHENQAIKLNMADISNIGNISCIDNTPQNVTQASDISNSSVGSSTVGNTTVVNTANVSKTSDYSSGEVTVCQNNTFEANKSMSLSKPQLNVTANKELSNSLNKTSETTVVETLNVTQEIVPSKEINNTNESPQWSDDELQLNVKPTNGSFVVTSSNDVTLNGNTEEIIVSQEQMNVTQDIKTNEVAIETIVTEQAECDAQKLSSTFDVANVTIEVENVDNNEQVEPTTNCLVDSTNSTTTTCLLLNSTFAADCSTLAPSEKSEKSEEDYFEDALAPEEEIRQVLTGRRVSLSRHTMEFNLNDQMPDLLMQHDEVMQDHVDDDNSSGHSSGNYQDVLDTTAVADKTIDVAQTDATNIADLPEVTNTESVPETIVEDFGTPTKSAEEETENIAVNEELLVNVSVIAKRAGAEALKVQERKHNLLDNSLVCPVAECLAPSIVPSPQKEEKVPITKDTPVSLLDKTMENIVDDQNKENIQIGPAGESPKPRILPVHLREKPRPSLLLQFDPLSNLNASVNEESAKPKAENINVSQELDLNIDMDAVHEEKMNLIQEVNRLKLELNQVQLEHSQVKQELSTTKLELNHVKQENTSLTLEIQKKEEVNLKQEANSQLRESQLKAENIQLLEKLELVKEDNNNEELSEVKKELKQYQAEVKKLTEELAHYKKIMNEYESTLSANGYEREKLKTEHATVTKHLAALEVSFSDTIKKYDRCKEIINGYSRNEEILNERLEKSQQIAIKYEERYETLKSHATSQLEKANKDLISVKEAHRTELSKLNTLIKRVEIKNASLQQTLEQKTAECTALAQLCDEMTEAGLH